MTLEVEFWTLVSVCVTFVGGTLGLFLGLVRGTLRQTMQRLDERDAAMGRRLDDINKTVTENAAQWTRIERELLTLKADLPINYVRREDYVSSIATIMTKLDSISLRFENILLKGGKYE
jgi:hypothetical protein